MNNVANLKDIILYQNNNDDKKIEELYEIGYITAKKEMKKIKEYLQK